MGVSIAGTVSKSVPMISNTSESTATGSLVGLPGQSSSNASRGETAIFEIIESSFGHSLVVFQGCQIDTISKIGSHALEGAVPCEWLELGGCETEEEITPLFDALWRTLVADCGPNNLKVPSWYGRAFCLCLHHCSLMGDIDTSNIIINYEIDSSLVIEFLQRVREVIWNRRLLISDTHGWIGLAPIAARVEDAICILPGCSVPVILRPLPDQGRRWFEFVGEAYVHDMMNGEAMDAGYDRESFEIR